MCDSAAAEYSAVRTYPIPIHVCSKELNSSSVPIATPFLTHERISLVTPIVPMSVVATFELTVVLVVGVVGLVSVPVRVVRRGAVGSWRWTEAIEWTPREASERAVNK